MMPMRKAKHMKAILITLSVMALAASNVGAQINVSLDEKGVGTFSGAQNGTLPSAMAGSYRVQLLNGGTVFSPVLTYTLPWTITVTGDVLLREEGTGNLISDVLRFSTTKAVFFSEYESGAGGAEELADIGLPYQFLPSSATGQLIYAGPEVGGYPDGGWVDYTPTSTQPGYIDGLNMTYHIVSEIPEPSTLTIAGMSLLFALRMARKDRKA